MPLGLILLWFFITWVVAVAKKSTTLAVMLGAGFVALYGASLPWVGWELSQALVRLAMDDETKGLDVRQSDALVVLTAGNYFSGGGGGWMPRPEGVHRLNTALRVENTLGKAIPLVVSGGFTNGHKLPSEAGVLLDFYKAVGVRGVNNALVEDVSTDTYGSALEVARMAKDKGWKQVGLVTGDTHMARSLGSYRAVLGPLGVKVVPVLAKGLWGPFGSLGFLPSVKGLLATTDAVYDGLGYFYYKMGGRLD